MLRVSPDGDGTIDVEALDRDGRPLEMTDELALELSTALLCAAAALSIDEVNDSLLPAVMGLRAVQAAALQQTGEGVSAACVTFDSPLARGGATTKGLTFSLVPATLRVLAKAFERAGERLTFLRGLGEFIEDTRGHRAEREGQA